MKTVEFIHDGDTKLIRYRLPAGTQAKQSTVRVNQEYPPALKTIFPFKGDRITENVFGLLAYCALALSDKLDQEQCASEKNTPTSPLIEIAIDHETIFSLQLWTTEGSVTSAISKGFSHDPKPTDGIDGEYMGSNRSCQLVVVLARDKVEGFGFGNPKEEEALRDWLQKPAPAAAKRTDPPRDDPPPPPPPKDDHEALIEKVILTVADWLGKRPEVAKLVRAKLQITVVDAAAVAAEILRRRGALEVAMALNQADYDLEKAGAEFQDRLVIRSLLFQILPFTIDWSEFVARQRESRAGGATSFDLPYRSGTVAEIVIAGVDARCCHFSGTGTDRMPVAAALVPLPAATLSALFDTGGVRGAELVVEHLAAELFIKSTGQERQSDVEARLGFHADPRTPADDYLPYYIVLKQGDTGSPAREKDLFTLARRALGSAVPSLGVHLLTGSPNNEHSRLGLNIGQIIRRTPKDPR